MNSVEETPRLFRLRQRFGGTWNLGPTVQLEGVVGPGWLRSKNPVLRPAQSDPPFTQPLTPIRHGEHWSSLLLHPNAFYATADLCICHYTIGSRTSHLHGIAIATDFLVLTITRRAAEAFGED